MGSKQKIDNTPTNLLYSLCKHVLNQGSKTASEDAVARQFQFALRLVGSRFAPSITEDEFKLLEKIKKQFVRKGKETDAAAFADFHRRLQAQDVLQNRWAILYLLFSISQDGKSKGVDQSSLFGGALPAFSSTPHPGHRNRSSVLSISVSGLQGSDDSSGFGSHRSSSVDKFDKSSVSAAASRARQLAGTGDRQSRMLPNEMTRYQTDPSDLASMVAKSLAISRNLQVDDTARPAVPFAHPSGSVLHQTSQSSDNTKFQVTEQDLIRDILFVFQGIEGKMIKFDNAADGYRISSDLGVQMPVRDLVHKLAELGWLFRRVRKFLDARIGDKALGLVGQSFCGAVQKELTEYYRLMAVLEAQQNQFDQGVGSDGSGLTLRRLVIWTFDPLIRMKSLAALVDSCKGKKGGALLSEIFSYTQIGDPLVKNLVKHILNTVSRPMKAILDRWIYEGELQDTFHEFFIAADPSVKNERLWHDKYSLRRSMIPSFIPSELANKVLNIGKSINFIRVVCDDRSPIGGLRGRREITTDTNNDESDDLGKNEGFSTSALQEIIDVVYKNTSTYLLDVFFKKYRFLDHLKAMRRYLLLGQGDFIRHLMDLLKPHLAKPAHALYQHHINSVLESAIRGSNAQYDDPEMLRRLDSYLLEVSPGDYGWDVFSLTYHVDGPIQTVFTHECILHYLRIFNFLWRAKRMEYCLTDIWKNQVTHQKLLRGLPELAPLFHQSHCLEAEMVHFIHQMQYYITFEVLECCWDELEVNVKAAHDLDHVIAAHETFLDQVMTRALLDHESRAMLTQLRAIFDLIIQFQSTQENMYTTALEEMNIRFRRQELIEGRQKEGKWGTTDAETDEEVNRAEAFHQTFIPNTRAQLRVLHQSYQDMLQKFLVMLNGHSDVSLRFLCFRLDFNEHYKRKEPKLRSPMSRYSRRYKSSAQAVDVKL